MVLSYKLIEEGGNSVSVDLAPLQDGVDDDDQNPTNEINGTSLLMALLVIQYIWF